MTGDLGNRLRRQDLSADLEFLERRRTDHPYVGRVEHDYNAGFGPDVRRVIDEKSAIRQGREQRGLSTAERAELYRRIRADFFACLAQQEQAWLDGGKSVVKEWKRVLTRQLPHNGRNSLRRIAELHAREFLMSR